MLVISNLEANDLALEFCFLKRLLVQSVITYTHTTAYTYKNLSFITNTYKNDLSYRVMQDLYIKQ